MVPAPSSPAMAGSGLQQLLELESRLAQELAAARGEAERLRSDARAEAEAIRQREAGLLAIELRNLTARLEAERAEAANNLRDRVAQQALRYAELDPAAIEAAARAVLVRLLET